MLRFSQKQAASFRQLFHATALLGRASTRGGAVAARRAHNPKVDGSNPSAATIPKTSRTMVAQTSVLEVLNICLRTMQS